MVLDNSSIIYDIKGITTKMSCSEIIAMIVHLLGVTSSNFNAEKHQAFQKEKIGIVQVVKVLKPSNQILDYQQE